MHFWNITFTYCMHSCVCVLMCIHTNRRACLYCSMFEEDREQHVRVNSFLPLCRSWGLNSGSQFWWKKKALSLENIAGTIIIIIIPLILLYCSCLVYKSINILRTNLRVKFLFSWLGNVYYPLFTIFKASNDNLNFFQIRIFYILYL